MKTYFVGTFEELTKLCVKVEKKLYESPYVQVFKSDKFFLHRVVDVRQNNIFYVLASKPFDVMPSDRIRFNDIKAINRRLIHTKSGKMILYYRHFYEINELDLNQPKT